MKKAKNVFAILGFCLVGVATVLLMLHPVIDGIASNMSGGSGSMPYGEYFNDVVLERVKLFFNFEWFKAFSEGIKVGYPMLVAFAGVALLIVLLIVMICKKHAKGLGWWIPMLIVLVLGVTVASVYIKPKLYDDYLLISKLKGYYVVNVTEWLMLGSLIAVLAGVGCLLLSAVFYIVYVCKASAKAKKINDARQAAIAKIDALLGGNK